MIARGVYLKSLLCAFIKKKAFIYFGYPTVCEQFVKQKTDKMENKFYTTKSERTVALMHILGILGMLNDFFFSGRNA